MKRLCVIFAFLSFAVCSAFADIAVSDVKVFSGYPWKEVVIEYTVTGTLSVPSGTFVYLKLTAQDQAANKTYETTSFSSALKGAETTPGRHLLRWNAASEGVKFKSDNVVFTVSVMRDPLYCIIDLSGGASATSYPVTYMQAPPSGGFNVDTYKTTKLVLRRIDAGSFIRGEDQADSSHRVTLTKPFYVGLFEVTQKQWSLVMGSNPCASTSYGKGDTYPVHYVSYNMIRGSTNGAEWPASSSVDSTSFLGKLRAKTGINFDLPTEAQWEYACRAGTTTTYYWGNSMNDNYAWYSGNSTSKTHPVGGKTPNPWGLYDMSGNVREWCLDRNGAPTYGTNPKGPSSGSNRVKRGGNWNSHADYCRSSYRDSNNPSYGLDYDGFRLVGTLPE